jgi:hypothetical protein
VKKDSDKTVQLRLNEAYRWLLIPTQQLTNGSVGPLEWEITQATGNGDSIVARASRRLRWLLRWLRSSEHLIVKWSPALLKMELDRWFWKDQDHVSVKEVWDAFCAYCYLPRLRDQTVFVEAIQVGIASCDYFGYATRISADNRYEGLKIGTAAAAIYVDGMSVLAKPEVARAQRDAERPQPGGAGPQHGAGPVESPKPGASGPGEQPERPRLPASNRTALSNRDGVYGGMSQYR